MSSSHRKRRKIISFIGNGTALQKSAEQLCLDLGRLAIEAGFRIASGGLGGVMEAVSRGAREAEGWREGDILGLIPSHNPADANPSVDIVIPTGLGWARNLMVVATADVVIAVGGASGTLSELALAWQLGKPIIALRSSAGWAAKLAGQGLDEKRNDQVISADSAGDAIDKAMAIVADTQP